MASPNDSAERVGFADQVIVIVNLAALGDRDREPASPDFVNLAVARIA